MAIKLRGKFTSLALLLVMASFSTAAVAAVSYAGTWHAYFDGGNTGTCQIRIARSGDLSGMCKGNLPAFKVSGDVSGNQVHFGVASTGARFSGVMVSSTHGIGHWENGENSGAWYIRKN
ncbi:MAG: hypothetical protein ACYCS8_07840 [Acidithiobacillus sp.]|uniref:hypothetical protein n=1 Tax=Acidithiobacillus thiooxidans TaxID=930 RepID=UPI0009D9916B|nr:hypothetical protein [Acidithiobacillus thiooxidans]